MKNILRLTGLQVLLFLCIHPQAQTPHRFDIVIDELFPDPTPAVSLPGSEFIELKNVSTTAFNLKGFKLSDGTSTATINVSFVLKPDSFVIICPTSATASFAVYGTTIGVSSFPALNNDADIITLYAPDGSIIHSVAYNMSWYHNDVKSEGGWSLEMIDPNNPCAGGNNWTSSTSNDGGTPGKINAVNRENKDEQAPALVKTYTINDSTIVAVFDEPIDSTAAAIATNYTLDNGIGHPSSAEPVLPGYTEVKLSFAGTLKTGIVYILSVSNVYDCTGNSVGALHTAKAGLPLVADSLSIAINELLFDPVTDGYDYIELYNNSKQVADLKQLYLSNRATAGNLTNIKQLSTTPYLFFPGEYLLFTTNRQWVIQHYIAKYPDNIIELPSLPSFPDDKGTAVLTNLHGNVVDELRYDAKWHFPLISDPEGVALERISYQQPAQNKNNWTSAASTAGYGTPGYINSQSGTTSAQQALLEVNPRLFSPDNDGVDDFATISYRATTPGNIVNITIYDVQGRAVRYLAKNAIPGITGNFRWDGLDEKANRLPLGVYIIVSEFFNQEGKKQKFKNTITLVRKL
ncbi:MAG: lamin tail domain-containing protein [Chitinophagaceae bacterium]